MAHLEEDHSYHPKDAISAAIKATAITGGVGLFASAVQNTLTKQNVGPFGVFVRTGGTIGFLGKASCAGAIGVNHADTDIFTQPQWVVPTNSLRLPRPTCASGKTPTTLLWVDSFLEPFWVFEVS